MRADLTGANLTGAYLSGANLQFTCVVGFQLCRYFGFRHGDYIKIGCIDGTIEWWLTNYKAVGKEHRYTADEISLVGGFLKLLNRND